MKAFLPRNWSYAAWIILVASVGLRSSASACSIFVLKDSNQALFFNNEDWSNPNARIWFVPAGEGYYGCAYVGFDDGWGQGGVNTEGLAYDWVAGYSADWAFTPGLIVPRGNSSQRMLETCSRIDEAIAYYQKHFEPSFSRAKILIADRTGASVIIGADGGKLVIERAQQCRGFGYGEESIRQALNGTIEPTVARGLELLRACRQEGKYATKYSNVFDLKSGEIYLIDPSQPNHVRINLAAELKKGGHYYELPQLARDLAEGPKPLTNEMKRFFLDEFSALADQAPDVTSKVKAALQGALAGTLDPAHYTHELWSQLSPIQEAIQSDLKSFGNLDSLTLVNCRAENERRVYQYKIEFASATVLQSFAFDPAQRIASIHSDGVEWKSSPPGK